MLISERVLKWAMRFYPPLLFQRIWVKKIASEFRSAEVTINHSILNINYNRSIFGGTLYSAADTFFPVLYHQILKQKGFNVQIWVKAAEIKFLKPGYSTLFFKINISDQHVEEIISDLNSSGKHVRSEELKIVDKASTVCASVKIEVYFRTFTHPKNN